MTTKNLFILLCFFSFAGCFGLSQEERRYEYLMDSIAKSDENYKSEHGHYQHKMVELIEQEQELLGTSTLLDATMELDEASDKTFELIYAITDHIDSISMAIEIEPIMPKDETGFYPVEDENGHIYFLGDDPNTHKGRGNGKAFELSAKLDSFIDICNHVRNQYLGDSQVLPYISNPSSENESTWEQENFSGELWTDHLSSMEKIETEVFDIRRNIKHDLKIHYQNLLDEADTVQVH